MTEMYKYEYAFGPANDTWYKFNGWNSRVLDALINALEQPGENKVSITVTYDDNSSITVRRAQNV